MSRARRDDRGAYVRCSRTQIFECCMCRKRMTGAELLDRRFNTGLCACGASVDPVKKGKTR